MDLAGGGGSQLVCGRERLGAGPFGQLVRRLKPGGRSFSGDHYRYRTGRLDLAAAVGLVQDRIPMWVVGVWPAPRSMRRTLRCDGVVQQYRREQPGPKDAAAVRAWLAGQGIPASFDVIADGETPADDAAAAAAAVQDWADAGCTWWLKTRWTAAAQMRERLAAGPPRDRLPEPDEAQ